MKKTVLSVVKEEFRDRDTGKKSVMYRVYLMADDGRIGYIYTNKEVFNGQEVTVGLAERDGRLKLRLLV